MTVYTLQPSFEKREKKLLFVNKVQLRTLKYVLRRCLNAQNLFI